MSAGMQSGHYTGGDGYILEYDVFYPAHPGTSAPPFAGAPTIVLFFGGAWRRGERSKFHPQARYFSALGYVVFTPDYRVFNRQHVSPRESVEDAVCFWRYLRENAARLRIDPRRVALGGDSAGGHIAIMAGIKSGTYPAAYILYNPVVSAMERVAHITRLKKRQLPSPPKGGPSYDKLDDISPSAQLGAYFPPSIFLQGGLDILTPVAIIKAFIKKLTAIGAPTELHIYIGRMHGFFTERRSKRCFLDTNQKIAVFLQKYMHGAPTSTEIQQIPPFR